MLYLFGVFLVYSGIKMMLRPRPDVQPEKNNADPPDAKVLSRSLRIWTDRRFTTHWNGRHALTPLALVLVMVETTDLIFAVDSIPAIFAVTTKPFIVFTSNVFAILGLRSLYFVLAGAIGTSAI